jgi:CBS-domain-containing membrane protein
MHGRPLVVSDVMTRTLAAAGARAPFKEIVRTMRDRRVSALPVVDDEGRVAGVVSEADLLSKEEFRDSGPGLPPSRADAAGLARAGAGTAAELMT